MLNLPKKDNLGSSRSTSKIQVKGSPEAKVLLNSGLKAYFFESEEEWEEYIETHLPDDSDVLNFLNQVVVICATQELCENIRILHKDVLLHHIEDEATIETEVLDLIRTIHQFLKGKIRRPDIQYLLMVPGGIYSCLFHNGEIVNSQVAMQFNSSTHIHKVVTETLKGFPNIKVQKETQTKEHLRLYELHQISQEDIQHQQSQRMVGQTTGYRGNIHAGNIRTSGSAGSGSSFSSMHFNPRGT